MGRFNDLPKDVIWLIYRELLRSFYTESARSELELDGCGYPNWWNMRISHCLITLALISHQTLNVVRSKTVRDLSDEGWWFIKGALTG